MIEMTDAELMEFGPPPHWANGLAHGKLVPGAQLCTRDGRKCGNAVVFGLGLSDQANVIQFYNVVTDAGTVMNLSDREIQELFYSPVWVMEDYLSVHRAAIEAYIAELVASDG